MKKIIATALCLMMAGSLMVGCGGEKTTREDAGGGTAFTFGTIAICDGLCNGMDGKKVKLSDVETKMVMLYFWSSTAEQKMFNISALLPLYEEFHPKGLEIYAVALDTDKTAWATAVRNQKLPWVNVCDTRGAASPYVQSYGVASLPMLWMIKDGTIDPVTGLGNIDALKAYLKKNLR